MGRIRSIHPEQWTDDKFGQLSHRAMVIAIGLRNFTDDNGIFDCNAAKIKVSVIPYSEATATDVEQDLCELEEQGQIQRYVVDGKQYGAIRNFLKFQSPRKPTYRWPLPDDDLGHGYEFETEAVVSAGKKKARRVPDGEDTAEDYSADFERWWVSYPKRRRRDKKGVYAIWNRIQPSTELTEKMIASVRASSKTHDWMKENNQFVPMPATWLNKERWNDELPEDEAAPTGVYAGKEEAPES